jgi:hypothetical protein
MELFGKARLRVGKYFLQRRVSEVKRKAHYSNINHVKKIGIVWDASVPEDFTHISRFYQKMSEKGVEVSVFAYFNGKELPDQLTAIRYMTCLKKNEVNFFYRPLADDAEKFIMKKFDVLIDININRSFPLYYVTALSVANFKVGLFTGEEETRDYELMIELKRPVKVDNYLSEVMNYLEMIKS